MLILILSLCLLNPVAQSICSCKRVDDEIESSGGNESVEINGRTVKRIYGKVTFSYGNEPAEDAIVEVFKVEKENDKEEAWNIVENEKRFAACHTDAEGKFCFAGLPPGKYVLRAGTKMGGFNFTYMRVKLAPRSSTASGKEIVLDLSIAT